MVNVQEIAPNFEAEAVMNGEFKTITLSQYAGKYLVLFFYPLDWTFVCPTEIIAFSEAASKFKALGAEVVGVSIDSKFSHFNWINTARKDGGLGKSITNVGEMHIPLVADITKKISKDYGVLINEGPDAGLAARGTFIIDPKQKIRVAQINDLPIGRSVDEVLRLLEAIQYFEKNGEVCPAGWKKGALTMNPDPVKSKAYFEKVF
jgi:alkyl hydroperoxide reductase subunit AhpC